MLGVHGAAGELPGRGAESRSGRERLRRLQGAGLRVTQAQKKDLAKRGPGTSRVSRLLAPESLPA